MKRSLIPFALMLVTPSMLPADDSAEQLAQKAM
jgi:hypothetical protein